MIPRCFVEPAEWAKPLVAPSAEDAHHWLDVLRVEPGMEAVVSDGLGGEAVGEVAQAAGGTVTVRIKERRQQDPSVVPVTLVQAVPKAQKMDWIIQKATEVGVQAIIPVMTDHGVVRLDEGRAGSRGSRWQKIATEAAKQCRTAWVPKVRPVVNFTTLMKARLPVETMLIGSLEPDAVPFKKCLAEWVTRRPRSVALLIGPEGDFSPAEIEAARWAGAIPVSYGTRVLRVETAALYGLSVLAHEFGSL
jgi:16S rRNA (uracil1498-N3)-methyltransferase